MDNFRELFTPGPVAVYVAAIDGTGFDTLLGRLATIHPGAAIFRVSGRESETQTGLFNELRRALDIPYHSISWNVLDEALFDLSWRPAEAYLMAVDDGDRLLADAPAGALQILGEILGSPPERHFTPGQPVISRHLLLQVAPPAADGLTRRLSDASIAFEVITGPFD